MCPGSALTRRMPAGTIDLASVASLTEGSDNPVTGTIERNAMTGDGRRKRTMTDDRSGPDDRGTGGTWLWKRASSLGGQIVGALVTTVSLSLGYMIFNDYIAPPPDLSGNWKFTVAYEETALAEFKGLQVTYQVLLVQEGLKLTGHGEKLSDRGPTQAAVDYAGDRRTNIRVQGTVARNFFSPDTLLLHYSEAGRRRESATIHRLAQCGREALCGCFRSTIADTSGSVWWRRRGGLERMYEPVDRPDDCRGANCGAAAGQCG